MQGFCTFFFFFLFEGKSNLKIRKWSTYRTEIYAQFSNLENAQVFRFSISKDSEGVINSKNHSGIVQSYFVRHYVLVVSFDLLGVSDEIERYRQILFEFLQ